LSRRKILNKGRVVSQEISAENLPVSWQVPNMSPILQLSGTDLVTDLKSPTFYPEITWRESGMDLESITTQNKSYSFSDKCDRFRKGQNYIGIYLTNCIFNLPMNGMTFLTGVNTPIFTRSAIWWWLKLELSSPQHSRF
jgi:hypothetical protein